MENIGLVSIPVELQVEVLGYFLKDREVLGRFAEVFTEEYFQNPVFKIIFRLLKGYYLKYLRLPTRKVLEQELGVWLAQNSENIPIPSDYFWQELDNLYSVQTAERDYLIDKVQSYVIRVQLKRISDEIGNVVVSSDVRLDGVYRELQGLFTIQLGNSMKQNSEFLLADASKRLRENPAIDKVPTGFRTLDSVLNGGLGKGELGVVMAPTGVGKSFWLVTVGANALRMQKRVLHVTLELSREKVINRYESFLTRIPKNQLHIFSDKVQERLVRVKRLLGGADVMVVEYPSRSLSVDELRALIIQLSVSGNFTPDLLLVDYGDILKPVLTYRNEQGWEQLGYIFEKLRGLAQEFKIPVWTGSQSTPDSMRKEVITILDIAGSFQKVRIADVVLAICRTSSEVNLGKGRFYLDKNRDSRGKVIIPFREDFDTSRFWEEAGAEAVEISNLSSVEFSDGENL